MVVERPQTASLTNIFFFIIHRIIIFLEVNNDATSVNKWNIKLSYCQRGIYFWNNVWNKR